MSKKAWLAFAFMFAIAAKCYSQKSTNGIAIRFGYGYGHGIAYDEVEGGVAMGVQIDKFHKNWLGSLSFTKTNELQILGSTSPVPSVENFALTAAYCILQQPKINLYAGTGISLSRWIFPETFISGSGWFGPNNYTKGTYSHIGLPVLILLDRNKKRNFGLGGLAINANFNKVNSYAFLLQFKLEFKNKMNQKT